jgi:hypothetical protein
VACGVAPTPPVLVGDHIPACHGTSDPRPFGAPEPVSMHGDARRQNQQVKSHGSALRCTALNMKTAKVAVSIARDVLERARAEVATGRAKNLSALVLAEAAGILSGQRQVSDVIDASVSACTGFSQAQMRLCRAHSGASTRGISGHSASLPGKTRTPRTAIANAFPPVRLRAAQ